MSWIEMLIQLVMALAGDISVTHGFCWSFGLLLWVPNKAGILHYWAHQSFMYMMSLIHLVEKHTHLSQEAKVY